MRSTNYFRKMKKDKNSNNYKVNLLTYSDDSYQNKFVYQILAELDEDQSGGIDFA